MKIRIEVDNKIKENEVSIRCSELSEDVKIFKLCLMICYHTRNR